MKALVKKTITAAAWLGGTVAGARLGASVVTPFASKMLAMTGIPQKLPAGVNAFFRDASIGLSAVGGFCLGNKTGAWIGKQIG